MVLAFGGPIFRRAARYVFGAEERHTNILTHPAIDPLKGGRRRRGLPWARVSAQNDTLFQIKATKTIGIV